MDLRLLRREPARADEIGDERVVVGELLEAPVAEEVGAGVADVADDDARARDERGRDRRPHARRVRVARRPRVDATVRLLDDGAQARLGVERVRLVEVAERARREPRRDLSRLGAPHPVGDGEQRGLADEGVLVAPAHAARVRQPRDGDELHATTRSVVSPMRSRSPSVSRSRPSMRRPFTKVPLRESRSTTHNPSRSASTRAWLADAYSSPREGDPVLVGPPDRQRNGPDVERLSRGLRRARLHDEVEAAGAREGFPQAGRG